ncbi:hypothetical protein ACIRG5_45780 [Lentzea sp. NPDC102401]|uniref:hypothetical protein n=1 Tax=Lentzea sp. NPDC102401 TaxID=3364128 RepID=UPI0038177695
MPDTASLFTPAVPTPLHLAVLVRLHRNHGISGKLTSELAEEFASLGWCTAQDYTRVTHELIAGGLAEGVQLSVNPLLHTGDECRRCAEHVEVYAQEQRDHQRAVERWQAGAAAYPYVTSTASIHLRDCTHITAEPRPCAPTLEPFVHTGGIYSQQRLVLGDDTVVVSWEDLEPGGEWWDRPYGPPPGDGEVGVSDRIHCMSVREARARTLPSSGRRRSWKPCKVCRPIDPFLLDTADTAVIYRADTHPADVIAVVAEDGQHTTPIKGLPAPHGSSYGWGPASDTDRARTALAILIDAASATAMESPTLPCAEFADTFPAMKSTASLRIDRAEVRAWLRDWYRDNPARSAPAALAVLVDRDLAVRPDSDRLSNLR